MKLDMTAKPSDDDMPLTEDGSYNDDQLECMLQHYVEAKKIEADSKLFNMVKDYALSKNKMVEEMFDKGENKAPVKSLKDLKTKYKEVVEKDNKPSEE